MKKSSKALEWFQNELTKDKIDLDKRKSALRLATASRAVQPQWIPTTSTAKSIKNSMASSFEFALSHNLSQCCHNI